MSNLERFAAWAELFTGWCECEDGPDSISVTVDRVTLVVSAERASLFTPAGASELHIGERWALASPSSSKQTSQRDAAPADEGAGYRPDDSAGPFMDPGAQVKRQAPGSILQRPQESE